jgi:type II secretory pathway pseudopilin PulG
MAAMTVVAILIAGYVPHLARQMQREREEELLFRGQQIVEAIAQYVQMTGRYPSSLEELVRGFSIQTPRGMRRVRFLRPSALRDPMTTEEWKLVRPGDPVLRRFVEAYLESIGQPAPPCALAVPSAGDANPDARAAEDTSRDPRIAEGLRAAFSAGASGTFESARGERPSRGNGGSGERACVPCARSWGRRSGANPRCRE